MALSTVQTGPYHDTSRPKFQLPANSCDTHVHIYGPISEYPFQQGLAGLAFDAPNAWLVKMHRVIGVKRCVIVHAAPHGFDLRVTRAAMLENGHDYRGVALLDPEVSDAELNSLHEAGFRGVRFNLVRHLKTAPDLDVIKRVVSRVMPLGWHVCLHMESSQIFDYEETLNGFGIPIVFDHMLRIDPAHGLTQAPFLKLLEFLRGGRSWVKLSALEKLSREPYPHDDMHPFAAALIEAAPDRVLWATDWPHPLSGSDGPPDDGGIVDLIPLYAPDPAVQRKLLVENPTQLYGFDAV